MWKQQTQTQTFFIFFLAQYLSIEPAKITTQEVFLFLRNQGGSSLFSLFCWMEQAKNPLKSSQWLLASPFPFAFCCRTKEGTAKSRRSSPRCLKLSAMTLLPTPAFCLHRSAEHRWCSSFSTTEQSPWHLLHCRQSLLLLPFRFPAIGDEKEPWEGSPEIGYSSLLDRWTTEPPSLDRRLDFSSCPHVRFVYLRSFFARPRGHQNKTLFPFISLMDMAELILQLYLLIPKKPILKDRLKMVNVG